MAAIKEAPAEADALRTVKSPYGFFSAHVLVAASHVPPAFVRSVSVLAAAAPAKAGPVKANARASASIERGLSWRFLPYARNMPRWLNAFLDLCSRNARTLSRVNLGVVVRTSHGISTDPALTGDPACVQRSGFLLHCLTAALTFPSRFGIELCFGKREGLEAPDAWRSQRMSAARAELYASGKADRYQELKQTFLALSQSWRRLAVELENAQALLDAINEMDAIRLP